MKVLISGCVTGMNVRWNARNKLHKEFIDWAARVGIELVPVCPENELFGTPRKPIRLQSENDKVVAKMAGEDVYQKLRSQAKKLYARHPDAVGFIGISGSPSCGISAGVRGLGKTIKAPMHEAAQVPTIDINSLRSTRERANFLDRVVRYFTEKSCRS